MHLFFCELDIMIDCGYVHSGDLCCIDVNSLYLKLLHHTANQRSLLFHWVMCEWPFALSTM